MATLISLPEVLQSYISDFLRPHRWIGGNVDDLPAGVEPNPTEIKVDPLSKTRDVASIKAVHRNFKDVPLWKRFEWAERIGRWRDENLRIMRWKYQHGTLPEKMIKLAESATERADIWWERKINHDYRQQNCYVETMWGKGVGTGFVTELKPHKVIWFEVSLYDLITGIRPLPHCFGNACAIHMRADSGVLQLSPTFVPEPSLETLIPIDKRREWLIECFTECVLAHWGRKMIEKNGGAGEKPDFIKEFKWMMDLPPDYELSQTQLFRMFLRELLVRSSHVRADLVGRGVFDTISTQNIDELCRQEINVVK